MTQDQHHEVISMDPFKKIRRRERKAKFISWAIGIGATCGAILAGMGF